MKWQLELPVPHIALPLIDAYSNLTFFSVLFLVDFIVNYNRPLKK